MNGFQCRRQGQHHRGTLLLALGTVAALFLSACGNDSNTAADSGDAANDSTSTSAGAQPDALADLVEAAQAEEGPLVWYAAVGSPALSAGVAEAFTEAYGIEVEYLEMTTGPLMERFSAEQESGVRSADVIEIATTQPFADFPEFFAPIADVPNYDEYPSDFKSEMAFTTAIYLLGATYNTGMVSPGDVPDSWEDLVDAKWKGQVLLTDPRATPTWMGWAARMEETLGLDYLSSIAELDPVLSDSASSSAAQVTAGAYPLAFPAGAVNSAEQRAQGAPVAFTSFDGSIGSSISLGLVANAPHPNSARLFLAYRMSAEAAEVACSVVPEGAFPHPDVECTPLSPDFKAIDLAVFNDEASRSALLDALGIR